MTVTELAADGSSRDHATFRSPTFGRRSRPFPRTANRALRVNRTDCRFERRLNRGGPILGPWRFPLSEAKKFRHARSASASACCNTTAETSPSHARSGVRFASAISCLDSCAVDGYGKPSMCERFLAATASL